MNIIRDILGVAWFMGHLQYNIRGCSSLSTEDVWEVSRTWAKGEQDG